LDNPKRGSHVEDHATWKRVAKILYAGRKIGTRATPAKGVSWWRPQGQHREAISAGSVGKDDAKVTRVQLVTTFAVMRGLLEGP